MNQIKPWYEFSVTELAECYKTIITQGVHKQQVVVPVFVDLIFNNRSSKTTLHTERQKESKLKGPVVYRIPSATTTNGKVSSIQYPLSVA